MLLNPEEGRATEISDDNGIYNDLEEDALDIVDVRVDDDDRLAMKSVRKMSCMKPPEGSSMTSAQVLEWPTKSYDFVNFVMDEQERAERFIEILHDED
jgi:hypothetical protein